MVLDKAIEEELAPLAVAARIDLQVEILVSTPIHVMGDIDRLYRAISHLITNAIQYTSAPGMVTIRLESLDHSAIVTVQDTGIGIAPADLPHILIAFIGCKRIALVLRRE